MSETQIDMTVLSHDGIKYPVSEFPAVTQWTLMQRAFSHIFQNEIASAVGTWKTKNSTEVESEVTDEATGEVTKVKNLVEPSDAAIAEQRAKYIADKLVVLREGKLGSGSGPRGPKDPLADYAVSLARGDVVGAINGSNRKGKVSQKDIDAFAVQLFEKNRDSYLAKAKKALDAAHKSSAGILAMLDAKPA